MFYTIDNPANLPEDLVKVRLLQSARKKITFYRMGVTERQLEKYLQNKYHTQVPLKTMCLKIVFGAKYTRNLLGDIVVIIPNEDLDTIARIITYGTGRLGGSNILRYAMSLKPKPKFSVEKEI